MSEGMRKSVSFSGKDEIFPERPEDEPKPAEVENPGEDSEAPPPPVPKRPLSPLAQAENTLKEAFPSIEEKYIKTVLIASSGALDPAFNALLYLSDPNFKPEIPPTPPAAPQYARGPSRRTSQLEEDESLARELDRKYNSSGRPSRPGRPARPASQIDDSINELKEQFTYNINMSKTKVTNWFNNVKKNLLEDNDDDEMLYREDRRNPSTGGRPVRFNAFGAPERTSSSSSSTTGRARKGGAAYDRDNYEISDDFSGINLVDNDVKTPPPKPPRPSNTLQSDSQEDMKLYGSAESGDKKPAGSSPTKDSKWTPLKVAEPLPVADDNEFLVDDDDDDSDEDKEVKSDEPKKDVKKDTTSEETPDSSKELSKEPADKQEDN